jgi:hypothetical protein
VRFPLSWRTLLVESGSFYFSSRKAMALGCSKTRHYCILAGINSSLLTSLKRCLVLLRLTGSNVDRERGLQELRETAAHGHYLEPFAKLLLAVAASREKQSRPCARTPWGITPLPRQRTVDARDGPYRQRSALTAHDDRSNAATIRHEGW